MEQSIAIIALLFFTPYIAWFWIYAATQIKKTIERDWKGKKRGIQAAVAQWSQATSEERMNASLPDSPTSQERATWTNSPTPEDEIKVMNDRAYKEGLIHEPPSTVLETNKDVQQNIRPNQ